MYSRKKNTKRGEGGAGGLTTFLGEGWPVTPNIHLEGDQPTPQVVGQWEGEGLGSETPQGGFLR